MTRLVRAVFLFLLFVAVSNATGQDTAVGLTTNADCNELNHWCGTTLLTKIVGTLRFPPEKTGGDLDLNVLNGRTFEGGPLQIPIGARVLLHLEFRALPQFKDEITKINEIRIKMECLEFNNDPITFDNCISGTAVRYDFSTFPTNSCGARILVQTTEFGETTLFLDRHELEPDQKCTVMFTMVTERLSGDITPAVINGLVRAIARSQYGTTVITSGFSYELEVNK